MSIEFGIWIIAANMTAIWSRVRAAILIAAILLCSSGAEQNIHIS